MYLVKNDTMKLTSFVLIFILIYFIHGLILTYASYLGYSRSFDWPFLLWLLSGSLIYSLPYYFIYLIIIYLIKKSFSIPTYVLLFIPSLLILLFHIFYFYHVLYRLWKLDDLNYTFYLLFFFLSQLFIFYKIYQNYKRNKT